MIKSRKNSLYENLREPESKLKQGFYFIFTDKGEAICRQIFRPVKKTFSKLWEYCPKGNPYPTEVCLGRFGVVHYNYQEKMIKLNSKATIAWRGKY